MPTKKELQEALDTMTLIAYHLDKENVGLKGRLNDNEKEAMIALDMAYEKRKKLEKENQQLKREIYEIVGEEGVILGQTGFWNNDSNEVELKEWVEPIQN